jgi:hypothetical protein
LSSQEKEKLYALLDKHKFLFKGTLGLLPTKPVHVEIKSNAKPFHGRAFSVPKAYESMIRNEVERLCRLNVLHRCNESEWAAPSFGNLLRSNFLIAQDLDTVSAQQELLMPVMWAINTTFHTTLKASPAQLAFSRDMILPTSFAANWYAINHRKQAQSQSAADAENRKRIPHEFRLNDKVLIRRDIGNPYLGKLAKPTEGPFKIIDVQQLPINGTVLIQRTPTSVERISIRRLLPFFERYN